MLHKIECYFFFFFFFFKMTLLLTLEGVDVGAAVTAVNVASERHGKSKCGARGTRQG